MLALTTSFALVCLAPVAAQASFGLEEFDLSFRNHDGSIVTQAGAHPYEMTTVVHFNRDGSGISPEAEVKDVILQQIAGLVADPTAVPRCSTVDFLTFVNGGLPTACPDSAAVGWAATRIKIIDNYAAVYNLVPPPGVALKLGFIAVNVPVTIEVILNHAAPYNGIVLVKNISQGEEVLSSDVTLWGSPADPRHDPYRGYCVSNVNQPNPPVSEGVFPTEPPTYGNCKTSGLNLPLLTLPRTCRGPQATSYAVDSWPNPGAFDADGLPDLGDPKWVTGSVLTHDLSEPPSPLGMTGCDKLDFSPSIGAQPTSKAATSPSGLDFSLDVHDEGLTNPSDEAVAASDIEKSVVTLPQGFSVNPSIAEGLEVCSEADLARETFDSAPGAGCPNASKIGTVEVETPLLDENVNGALYQATPYENPFGSLIALYVVIKNPTLGIIVKQPLRVEPDPLTGQITTVAEEMPQLPFSHFRLHFREGARSPLVTPPACGTYNGEAGNPEPVKAVLYPYAGGAPVTTTGAFSIVSGPDGQACPPGGLPPFHPNLMAGTVNNFAGHFSPFNVRITRSDSEQEITHFSIKLPPGVAGKLAGIPTCTDAQIARAAARTGPHGGQEELDDPSCPAASQVGRTLAGSGVGAALAYAPGKIYLAGPYHGAPLSMVAITSGVVGPFDIGTVVVRLAIKVNPETGEVFLDSTGSDPIPHIIKGIPIHLRDIRAYTDRPEFTYNPTSCAATSTSATVLGSGLDFVSEADDNPFVSTSPFQAADCASLSFKPKLTFSLKGGTKRTANPSLRAHVRMSGFGEAAIRYAQVSLPKSEFLEQGHIGTICTRVQFKEGAVPGEKCPTASIYGKVTAKTPILEAPLAGPIFLRSNPEHELPDLVAALHGQIDVALVGRIDSGDNGGIRNTFEFVPDAPVTSADFTFFGGKKSLLSNSRNLCAGTNKVKVLLKAHSGKRSEYKTPLKPTGCKKKAKKTKQRRR
jgi:hypothetical protein